MIMDFRVIKEDQRLESNWSGGKTWELAIYPKDAKYLDRDFLWRLSTANSNLDESSFTKLPDYDRILMVLEGDVVLAHGDQRSVHLEALQSDAFDGAVKTRCYGKLIKDYNLIYRKGCGGRMELMDLLETSRPVPMSAEVAGSAVSCGIFCLDGYAVVSCGENSGMVRPGEQAVINFPEGAKDDILVMGEGRCIYTEVIMGPAEMSPTDAKAGRVQAAGAGSGEPGTSSEEPGAGGAAAEEPDASGCASASGSAFADYKACLKLFLSRNRWAMIMRREGKSDVYYDRQLADGLRWLERRYVTMIIWIVGMLVFCSAPAFLGAGAGTVAVILILFTLVHLFAIAPCVYMKYLPRPLSSHMKSTASLNAAEQAYHQEEISEDPHFDRLMQKYASDDEAYFADESSPLHRFVKRK